MPKRSAQSQGTAADGARRSWRAHSGGGDRALLDPVPPLDSRSLVGELRWRQRRIEWIESALQPVRERLGHDRFDRLVSALAMVIGLEALLVLRDIRGLDAAEMEEVSRWAAMALLRASLEEGS